jgi:hypothetical protein
MGDDDNMGFLLGLSREGIAKAATANTANERSLVSLVMGGVPRGLGYVGKSDRGVRQLQLNWTRYSLPDRKCHARQTRPKNETERRDR